ncbi:MAG: GDP-L-fucose synthase family protein [Woeseiaceae bacterium]
MPKNARIYVPGHRGLVGAAIVRRLEAGGWHNLLLRTREEVDLIDRHAVTALFEDERPDYVFDAAAKVGGIHANNEYPADFIRDNILIQMNVIDAAYRAGVRKFVFLGSSCIYPKLAPQPLKEEYLLTGPLEPTNEWYAVAKISGIKVCQAYRKQYGFNAINLMPTNLYGPGDNFNLQTSHVLPALLRKFHEAKETGSPQVIVWGSGAPKREFLYVDNLADACVHLMQHYNDGAIINVGTGEDVSIAELANLMKDVVQYKGDIVFDRSKPDGTPRKLLDVRRLSATGWRYRTDLRTGIEETYRWFRENQPRVRA